MELYPHQKQLIAEIEQAVDAGNNRILLYAPTGLGKTVIASELAARAKDAGLRTLFVVNREPLVDQTIDKFRKFDIEPDVGKSGYKRRDSMVTIGMIQTMGARNDYPEADLILLDEAHGSTANQYAPIWSDPRYSESLVIGFTATPYRAKKTESLDEHYQTIVGSFQVPDLQELGFLSKCKTIFSIAISTDGVGVDAKTGDFKKGELQSRCNIPEVTAAALSQWQKHAAGMRTIVFTTGVAHCHAVAQAFNAIGVPADVVTGETPSDKRKELYHRLDSLDLQVLVSIDVLSVGFDLPSTQCGLSLRPTKSRGLYVQQLGRILRPSPGKEHAIWLDIAGNARSHGLIDLRRPIELSPAAEPEAPPTKACPECEAQVPQFAKVCPHCGYEFELDPAGEREAPALVDFESLTPSEWLHWKIEELGKAVRKKGHKPYSLIYRLTDLIQLSELDLDHWRSIAKFLGYKPGWAWHRYKEYQQQSQEVAS